jgi:endonuclease/exonuclease/phosphatase family metal-dependent hydrolase
VQHFEGPRRSRALGRPGPRTLIAAAFLAPWLVWAVVRTFGLESGPVIPAMTFTPYVGLISPLPLLLALLLRRWVVAAVALLTVAAFAHALLPRVLAGPQPAVRDGVTVRVMAANLYLGEADARTVVDLVGRHRVDVLALSELPPAAVAGLDRAGLRRIMPHRRHQLGNGGASASGLFSRRPITSLPAENSLGRQGQPRGLIAVPSAMPIDVQVIHPPPPINPDGRRVWDHMLGELTRPPGGDRLRLLAGDFNATLDHQALRRLLGDGGYVDAGDASGAGYDTTWPAGRDFPPEITIDHVLVDPRVRVQDVSVHTVARSDHRAVVATLVLPRAAPRGG